MNIYIASFSTLFKFLLFPAYRSTDFEVHRNWLAITKSLPINRWYVDSTSPWTLDYPPLFAWFEFLWAQVAQFFDPQMLDVKNLNYSSPETVFFMRLSVIISDIVLIYGTKECCTYLSQSGLRKSSKWSSKWRSPGCSLQALLLFSAGLILVDHLHFQYNGFLLGVLLISIAKILQDRQLASAFWFSVLLNLKHIFLYLAPVYFIYLLRNYVFLSAISGWMPALSSFSIKRLSKLVTVVLSVFTVSFGPFIYFGQIPQLLSRLFPFTRGLCHAYWAPNFWALYNFCDKALEIFIKKFDLGIPLKNSTITSGLAEDKQHAVLPAVPPSATFALTVLFILPCLMKLWRCPGNPLHFVRALVICGLTSFLFGWHVHEKAVLIPLLPLALVAVIWLKEAKVFLLLSTVGYYSLLPLLPPGLETPIKLTLIAFHVAYAYSAFSYLFDENKFLNVYETVYLLGFILVTFLDLVLPWILPNFPFLPLLIISVYCSIGICYCWINYYYYFLTYSEKRHKRKTH